jgi:hypothetical protein
VQAPAQKTETLKNKKASRRGITPGGQQFLCNTNIDRIKHPKSVLVTRFCAGRSNGTTGNLIFAGASF